MKQDIEILKAVKCFMLIDLKPSRITPHTSEE